MTLFLAVATVLLGGIAMGLHRLADMPKFEVVMWIITLALFLCFEASLHR